jgi:ribosomal protein S21
VLPLLKQKLPCEGIDRELRVHQHYEKPAKKTRL